MLEKMKQTVTKSAGRGRLIIQKNSPELLLAAGVVGFIGTIVLACRSTLKAEKVLQEHENRVSEIDEAVSVAASDSELSYDEEAELMDRRNEKIKTCVEFVKVYAPVIGAGTLSIVCILASKNIMKKRYLGAVAAYNAISEAFAAYRKRVVDEYGSEVDQHFRYGTTYDTIPVKVVDEDGKKRTEKEKVSNTNIDVPGAGAVFFDESNPNWDGNPDFNMMFLRGQQAIATDILRSRGHIFLNEVYDALGFPQTPEGCVIGWIANENGDNEVDFGLYRDDPKVRAFVNGKENIVLLDFNHDGIIWDKI